MCVLVGNAIRIWWMIALIIVDISPVFKCRGDCLFLPFGSPLLLQDLPGPPRLFLDREEVEDAFLHAGLQVSPRLGGIYQCL
jgi:hypothetical protein